MLVATTSAPQASAQELLFSLFGRYVDTLRLQVGIPGMTALIVSGRAPVWEGAYGFADVEKNIRVRPDTPFPIGSLTQPVGALMLGTCVEAGGLDIDQPISRWVSEFPSRSATVRHVLAHASDGEPPGMFRYAPERFAELTAVAQACNPVPYRQRVYASVIERLAMTDTVPGHDLVVPDNKARDLFSDDQLARFSAIVARVAVPYRVERPGRVVRGDYVPRALNAEHGLVSTVRDLARYEAALDEGLLLLPENRALAWTPANFSGVALPTGLGWFVQDYNGEPLIWQFSEVPGAYSGIILKAPARRLTLIMLANSDQLTSNAGLSRGDVSTSPFVRIFLRLFVS
ncbi:MAG: beta-lactamase family protein [Acidobacteria bacterium]|nr:beta-lactamase family protein [Acidobacteriota bacterium]